MSIGGLFRLGLLVLLGLAAASLLRLASARPRGTLRGRLFICQGLLDDGCSDGVLLTRDRLGGGSVVFVSTDDFDIVGALGDGQRLQDLLLLLVDVHVLVD